MHSRLFSTVLAEVVEKVGEAARVAMRTRTPRNICTNVKDERPSKTGQWVGGDAVHGVDCRATPQSTAGRRCQNPPFATVQQDEQHLRATALPRPTTVVRRPLSRSRGSIALLVEAFSLITAKISSLFRELPFFNCGILLNEWFSVPIQGGNVGLSSLFFALFEADIFVQPDPLQKKESSLLAPRASAAL